MVKHTQNNSLATADELFEFAHFVGLALKGLTLKWIIFNQASISYWQIKEKINLPNVPFKTQVLKPEVLKLDPLL